MLFSWWARGRLGRLAVYEWGFKGWCPPPIQGILCCCRWHTPRVNVIFPGYHPCALDTGGGVSLAQCCWHTQCVNATFLEHCCALDGGGFFECLTTSPLPTTGPGPSSCGSPATRWSGVAWPPPQPWPSGRLCMPRPMPPRRWCRSSPACRPCNWRTPPPCLVCISGSPQHNFAHSSG